MQKSPDNFRYSILTVISIVIAVTVNVLASYMAWRLGLPINLNMIGTIGAGMVGGFIPAILTAVVTSFVSTVFNYQAVFFTLANALIAAYAVFFSMVRSFRRAKDLAFFTVSAGVISGVIYGLIQWGQFGIPDNTYIAASVHELEAGLRLPELIALIAIYILLNIIDIAFATIGGAIVLMVVPSDTITNMMNTAWRQRPLSDEEIHELWTSGKAVKHPIQARMITITLMMTATLVVMMSWIGVRLYNDVSVNEKSTIVRNAAEFAAEYVAPERIGDYISEGREAPGYDETEKMLYRICKNNDSIFELFVFTINDSEVTYIFDVEEDMYEDDSDYALDHAEPGYTEPVSSFYQLWMDEFLEGNEIPPQEINMMGNTVLAYFYPVKDAGGKTVAYICTQAELPLLAKYMRDMFIRAVLILSGVFMLILAVGFWITSVYTIFPINAIAVSAEELVKAGDDQIKLDETVRKVRNIDINTGDEIEKLYHSICDVALNQSEQIRSLKHYAETNEKMQDGLIITMADMVESRDSDTGAHVQKTAAYVKIIVEGLKKKGYYAEKLTPKFMSDVVRSAPLHDVGKINISDSVLNKPGKLTPEEFEIIKTHTTAGKKIIEKAINTVKGENYLNEARNMAAYHHERWDGKGYPEGLHGEVIPLSARIMAVADVFDALTSERVYKPPFSLDTAISILKEGSGSQFDPRCVEVFIAALPEVEEVLAKYSN